MTYPVVYHIILLASRMTTQQTKPSGCGSAWLERLVWDQEVAGSNPVTPTTCGCSSMVEHQPSKLDTWVRFPSPAFFSAFYFYIMRCESNLWFALWSVLYRCHWHLALRSTSVGAVQVPLAPSAPSPALRDKFSILL